jgi:hypothetical protein
MRALFFLVVIGCSETTLSGDPRVEIIRPAWAVDAFEYRDPPDDLDVWLFIDQSGSMSDQVLDVRDGVSRLVEDLQQGTAWFSIWAASCSPEGEIRGPFDRNASPVDVMLAATSIPQASLVEQCFASVNAAYWSGEMRLEKQTLIVLVSDEDEQSGISAVDFAAWLNDKQPTAEVIPVVDTTDACGGLGSAYIELAQMYGRQPYDVCAPWPTLVDDTPFFVGTGNAFELSHEPMQSTIDVYFDWEKVQVDYTVSGKVLTFSGNPPDGAAVGIAYEFEP